MGRAANPREEEKRSQDHAPRSQLLEEQKLGIQTSAQRCGVEAGYRQVLGDSMTVCIAS